MRFDSIVVSDSDSGSKGPQLESPLRHPKIFFSAKLFSTKRPLDQKGYAVQRQLERKFSNVGSGVKFPGLPLGRGTKKAFSSCGLLVDF